MPVDPNSLTPLSADPRMKYYTDGLNKAGFGGMTKAFGTVLGKNSPSTPASASSANPGAFSRLETPQRQALLQSMLTRSRGGQPGGAPTAPLPTPNSNVPTTY